MKIDAIIFDLGGVILNLNYQRTIDAFQALSGKNFANIYTQHQQYPFFDALETGKMSPATFRTELKNVLGIVVSDKVLDEAWNAMLLDIPAERLELLQALKQRKRIFLLSNTNAIHKEAFDKKLLQQHGYPALDVFFEKAYYSHLVGDRKPHASIFEHVLKENRLHPQTTVFIDDTLQHIEGAKKVGLQTIHLQAPKTIVDYKDLLFS